MVTLSLPPGPFDLIHTGPQLVAFDFPALDGTDLASAPSACCSHFSPPLVQHRTRKGWSLAPNSFLEVQDIANTRRDRAAGTWARSGWAALDTEQREAGGDSDEENPSLPSLSSSRTSSSDDEDDASSTSSEDYFFGYGRAAVHIDRHAALSTATSMLFQSAPVPEPTSPNKRSALSPPSGRRRRSAKRSLTTPPASHTHTLPRLPDLVVTSLRRSQPLLPTVQLVSAFDFDLPVASASSRRQVAYLDLVDELDLNEGGERLVDELPWEWDSSSPIECPPSPSRRPACLELSAPPPAPPTVSKSPKPRLVANTAQLLMLSLEATMVRTGKIVSPLRQRQVVVRHGRAEVGSTLRTEVV